MARKRKSRSRARRFARATRTVYRRAKATTRRGYRKARRSGWLPLTMKESLLDFGVGAVTPTVNGFVAPYTDKFIAPWAGSYTDEVRTALIGVAAHKFGSGLIKDAGREMFRFAVLSAGQETGARFIPNTVTSSPVGMSNVVYA